MFRKLILALGATAILAGASLAPTAASASPWHWKKHHHWHGKYWGGYYGPIYAGGSYCYTVKKIVFTPYGPRPRRVVVCD